MDLMFGVPIGLKFAYLDAYGLYRSLLLDAFRVRNQRLVSCDVIDKNLILILRLVYGF